MKTKSARSKGYYRLVKVKPQNYEYKVGNHRYMLKFESIHPNRGKSTAIIQMNESTTNWVDESKEDWSPDPTIGKVLCCCYGNKFEIVYCLNMRSIVDKDPKRLKGQKNNTLNDAKNDKWIAQVCKGVDYIIVAYGDCKGVDPIVIAERKEQLLKILEEYDLYHVGG
ncbi:DUF1643 domain-containing protein [Paenibacillus favisporus]|uniref:DUF1643 domain-containing protein n=1 Tax=Paenibacillus favisporus TaxID=221028 RepID=UPI0013D27E85|nr:DUF1643 domain-containing protein [Paenibacillus favisporus]